MILIAIVTFFILLRPAGVNIIVAAFLIAPTLYSIAFLYLPVFIPVYASNCIFQITVSNLEKEKTIKSRYQPKQGNKFIVVYLSQQNVSNEMQVYTGKISLLDKQGNRYDHMDNLSNFWMVVLKPGGMNLGYLVYEMPNNGIPVAVELTGLDMPALRVSF